MRIFIRFVLLPVAGVVAAAESMDRQDESLAALGRRLQDAPHSRRPGR
jgi:hypothetical protein